MATPRNKPTQPPTTNKVQEINEKIKELESKINPNAVSQFNNDLIRNKIKRLKDKLKNLKTDIRGRKPPTANNTTKDTNNKLLDPNYKENFRELGRVIDNSTKRNTVDTKPKASGKSKKAINPRRFDSRRVGFKTSPGRKK
tara:strand:- start:3356 stop:3778 length:423 start_codon:yes stop_codon:yes gene_type:complete